MSFILIDFSRCKSSRKGYGGSEEKLSLIYDGERYMVKFQKDSPFGLRYNHISEYVGSHIYNMLGIKAQETMLGKYHDRFVVGCKDFLGDDEKFVPFNDVGESTIDDDMDNYQYTYEDILELINANRKLTNVEEAEDTFFDMFILDSLIGNFDRHGMNWGFIKLDDKYKLAPVFDNGSCMYPSMILEDDMERVMSDPLETDKRVYEFPTSQILLNGKKSSYFDVISSLKFKGVNDALKRVYKKIKMKDIYELIDEIEIISDTHKKFYKHMLKNRYEKIIKYSYQKLIEKENKKK